MGDHTHPLLLILHARRWRVCCTWGDEIACWLCCVSHHSWWSISRTLMFAGLKFVCVRKRERISDRAITQPSGSDIVFSSQSGLDVSVAPYVLWLSWSIGCRSLWKLWSAGHSGLLNDSGEAYRAQTLGLGYVLATWRGVKLCAVLARRWKRVERVHRDSCRKRGRRFPSRGQLFQEHGWCLPQVKPPSCCNIALPPR